MAKILVIGASGQLGSDLLAEGGASHEMIEASRATCDLESPPTLQATITAARPEVVINTAAFNDVVGCETKIQRAFQINGHAVREMALACRDVGARFITLSTDYVFDGQQTTPYDEAAACRPLQLYGFSKLTGELGALAAWEKTSVVRTCGLYGKKGSRIKGGNFVEHRLADAASQAEITMSAEQVVSPTSTRSLATALLQLTSKPDAHGVFHLVNEGACSWYEFTCEIFRLAGLSTKVTPAERKGEFGGIRRPVYSVLGNRRGRALGIELPDWKTALKTYMAGRNERR